MKSNLVKMMGCAFGALSATAGHAQADDTGAYVSVHAGWSNVNDTDLDYSEAGGTFNGTGPVDTVKTEVDLASAVEFGGAVGYDFGTVRADVEIDYSRNRVKGLAVKSLNGTAVTTISPPDGADLCDYLEVDNCTISGNKVSFSNGGKVRQLSALVNIWLDLPIGDTVTPYIGGGVGVGGFEIEGEGKASFAFQVGAGVAFSLSPKVALTVDFRHREINGARFTDAAAPSFALDVGKLKTNSVSAGIRIKF